MKKSIILVLVVFMVFSWRIQYIGAEQDVKTKYLTGVEHFRQSTVKINANKIIYFDPFRVDGEPRDADLVLITHAHGDHFSIGDIKKVINSKTILVVTEDLAPKAAEASAAKVITVVPDKEYDVDGVQFKTVPAYNTNKNYHPKGNKWVGYILYLNNMKYYMAGDTDVIPEMKDMKADIAFLPVGGTYTMTAEEAAQAANLIKPKVTVPIHFADVVGSMDDAKKFISLLDKSIDGVILKK